jgi:hypothetical protein
MTEPNETPAPEVLPPEQAPGPHAGSSAEPAPGALPASTPWSSPVPPAAAPTAPPAEPSAGPRQPRPVDRKPDRKLALLGALAILLLAVAQGALWYRVLLQPTEPAAFDARVNAPAALGARLNAIDARLTRLEQRPAPQTPDLAPLQARVAALEQRPQPQAASQPTPAITASSPSNTSPTSSSSPAPAATPAPSPNPSAASNPNPAPAASPTPKPLDLAPLEARIAALEQKPSPALAPIDTGVAQRVTADEARLAALEQKPPPAPAPVDTSVAQRVTADEARLAALEKPSQTPGQLADRTSRIARIQAAFIALSVGRPLGEIPDAPPALSRYATVAPPTEAALRLVFPAAAQAALAAAHPAPADQPVLKRLWAQAQDLVTVRQGDHVLLGDPAAGVLARAQTALDAGDLAAAVAALASLSGPQAQALAPWLDHAHGLLAARAALATLAAQT